MRAVGGEDAKPLSAGGERDARKGRDHDYVRRILVQAWSRYRIGGGRKRLLLARICASVPAVSRLGSLSLPEATACREQPYMSLR